MSCLWSCFYASEDVAERVRACKLALDRFLQVERIALTSEQLRVEQLRAKIRELCYKPDSGDAELLHVARELRRVLRTSTTRNEFLIRCESLRNVARCARRHEVREAVQRLNPPDAETCAKLQTVVDNMQQCGLVDIPIAVRVESEPLTEDAATERMYTELTIVQTLKNELPLDTRGADIPDPT
jgi:hypothetical protein